MPECLRPKAIVSREELVLMQCITWVFLPPPPPCPRTSNVGPRNQGAVLVHAFRQKFDRGTRGWFLCMTMGSPVPRKKNFPQCAGVCAASPFPQLITLTNEHQRSESQLTGL